MPSLNGARKGPENMIQFNKEIIYNLDSAISREWLETNGLGGFSWSTIIGRDTVAVMNFPRISIQASTQLRKELRNL